MYIERFSSKHYYSILLEHSGEAKNINRYLFYFNVFGLEKNAFQQISNSLICNGLFDTLST